MDVGQSRAAPDQQRGLTTDRRSQQPQQQTGAAVQSPTWTAAAPPLCPPDVAQRPGRGQLPRGTVRTTLQLPRGTCPNRRSGHARYAVEPQPRPHVRCASGSSRRRLAPVVRRQPSSAVIGAAVQGAIAAALASYRSGAVASAETPQRQVATDAKQLDHRQRPAVARGVTTRTASLQHREECTAPTDAPSSAASRMLPTARGQLLQSIQPVALADIEPCCSSRCAMGRCICDGCCCCGWSARTQPECCVGRAEHQRCFQPASVCRDRPSCCRLHDMQRQMHPRGCLLSVLSELQADQAAGCIA